MFCSAGPSTAGRHIVLQILAEKGSLKYAACTDSLSVACLEVFHVNCLGDVLFAQCRQGIYFSVMVRWWKSCLARDSCSAVW